MSHHNEGQAAGPEFEKKIESSESHLEADAIRAALTQYVARYNVTRKQSAEQYIARSKLIVEVEDKFGKQYLADFYAAIGEDPEKSTIRKMRKIGAAATRFVEVLDRLPDCWTTLYNLALLKPDKYQKLLDDGVLTPKATWAELRDHVMPAKAKAKKEKKAKKLITIDLDDIPGQKRRKFVKTMKAVCKEFSVKLPEEQEASLQDLAPEQEGEPVTSPEDLKGDLQACGPEKDEGATNA